jgi:carnosine N-methyltransferase
MLPANEHSSPRHRVENAHLNRRMHRDHGVWGASHPRYRLLEALFAFSRYGERNMAELERWRGLYKNVPQKQKQVCAAGA